jgi:DNA-binding MarR family transcriptional regulator
MDRTTSPTVDFMMRLRKIDLPHHLTCRDMLVLWAVAREPGMMGRQLALKLGYKSRSNVQICVARLIQRGFMEDRRPQADCMTPNDLYITPAGENFLMEIVPT